MNVEQSVEFAQKRIDSIKRYAKINKKCRYWLQEAEALSNIIAIIKRVEDVGAIEKKLSDESWTNGVTVTLQGKEIKRFHIPDENFENVATALKRYLTGEKNG